MIAWHAGVIAPLVAGLRFGGAPAALELVAQEWGGAFGVAMQVMSCCCHLMNIVIIIIDCERGALQGLDDVMDLIGDPMNTGKDSFQDFRCLHARLCSALHTCSCTLVRVT